MHLIWCWRLDLELRGPMTPFFLLQKIRNTVVFGESGFLFFRIFMQSGDKSIACPKSITRMLL